MSDNPANSGVASITQLIVRANAGDASALDELFTALYGELHALARARLRRTGPITGSVMPWVIRRT